MRNRVQSPTCRGKISEALRTDLKGNRYGNWVVKQYTGSRHESPYWLCRCDCGTEKPVCGKSLKSGASISCGCVRNEKTSKRFRTHGKTGTVEHNLWMSAKRRAKASGLEFDLNLEDIQVPTHCPLLGVVMHTAQGVLSAYSPSLDRLDATKGYVKGNVWVISHRANTIKSNANLAELKLLVTNLAKFCDTPRTR